MKLHHLRNLLAVSRQGSVRAAARELGLAQPALTRSIQELEHELGVPLFERKPRGLVPTAMGEAFILRAKSIDNEFARARDEIAQMRGMTHGSVRIAISMLPHMVLLPYALKSFFQRYPDVHLDIIDAIFPTVAAEMADGSIDCCIGPPPEHLPEGLIVEKIFESTRVIVCRKGHPLAGAKSLRDLVGADWISTSITAQREQELGPLFARHLLPAPKLVLQTHSALTLSVALLHSDLLAMLPVEWTQFELTKDVAQAIKVKDDLSPPAICIIQRAGLPLTPAAQHFCDLIRRAVEHIKNSRRLGHVH